MVRRSVSVQVSLEDSMAFSLRLRRMSMVELIPTSVTFRMLSENCALRLEASRLRMHIHALADGPARRIIGNAGNALACS